MAATRRKFLQSMAGATSLGLADLSPFRELGELVAIGAEPTVAVSEKVRFGPDIEPIVQLIEETPRAACIPVLIEQLRQGLPFSRFLAAVFMTMVRKQNSGHDVYMMHAVHRVSHRLRPEEKLLPLFWAVDLYKLHQEQFPNPPLAPMTGALPAEDKAAREFEVATELRDIDAMELALVALARNKGAGQIVELLWSHACRNGGRGGHAAIVLANCLRVLEAIGWEDSEPVLRFVVRDMHQLAYGGKTDNYYLPNTVRADRHLADLPAGWSDGIANETATLELFGLLRAGKAVEGCDWAIDQLRAGLGARAIWDALHLSTADLMVRHKTGWGVASRPLHANTSLNALHYAFGATNSSRTRLVTLLQAVAWTGDKTNGDLRSGTLRDINLTQLPAAPLPATASEAVGEIFSLLPPRGYYWDAQATKAVLSYGNRADADDACRKTFQLASQFPEAVPQYVQEAQSWLCRKATTDMHDYKFQAAILEDSSLVSPQWRPHLLAASVHFFHGAQGADYPAVEQARAALQKHG